MDSIKIIEKLINRCEECKLKECINCEISWTEVEAIKKLYKANCYKVGGEDERNNRTLL